MTTQKEIELAASRYERENRDYHDSDGVDVSGVWKAGAAFVMERNNNSCGHKTVVSSEYCPYCETDNHLKHIVELKLLLQVEQDTAENRGKRLVEYANRIKELEADNKTLRSFVVEHFNDVANGRD